MNFLANPIISWTILSSLMKRNKILVNKTWLRFSPSLRPLNFSLPSAWASVQPLLKGCSEKTGWPQHEIVFLSNYNLQKEITVTSPHWRRELCSMSFKEEYLHKLCGILLQGRCVSPLLFINLLDFLFISGKTCGHFILGVITNGTSILLLTWPMGTLSFGSVAFWHTPIDVFYLFWC